VEWEVEWVEMGGDGADFPGYIGEVTVEGWTPTVRRLVACV
jgi:hypothetical protein